jgi:para-aminobenzoate synthetase / 4-amino-4-deoxychorismate lyase
MEARFDDLSAAEPSFRLIEPLGVVQADRPDEIAAVIDAAETAAERGAWVAGFVSYEAAPGLDAALRVRTSRGGAASPPLAWFAMYGARQETALPDPPAQPPAHDGPAWASSVDRASYDRAIDEIHERIARGDTYQVNHTIRLRARVEGDPRGLYRDLCHAQRGRYAGYVDTGAFRIVSASPELFFRIDGDRISTRPMKGTAPRGRWLAEDRQILQSLRGSVKDRAENAMIVDLLRNDLTRIAEEGSVTWTDVFDAERYETVWQLTSSVSATVRSGTRLVDVFRALFPSGSVTGAPKVSTMGIIAELEDSPRGVYCGTVGYLAPPSAPGPRARFNVAIRTVVLEAGTGRAEYGVGGGITWDSTAGSEYDEVVAKARVLTARRPAFRLLETMLHEPGRGFRRLDEHLRRLRDSAEYFGFALDEREVVAVAEREAARFPGRLARVRLVIDRRGRVDGGGAPASTPPPPVTLAVDIEHRVDPSDPFLFHKTTLRDRYDDARARFPEAGDVILVNTRGELTETTIANIAVRLDGTWWTPPLDAGLLPGCERAALLRDGSIEERAVLVEELAEADGIAVFNSVRGWSDGLLTEGAALSAPASRGLPAEI